jgi:hypothetical protein
MQPTNEHEKGFWTHIRKRIVDFSTMERELRITFALGASVVPLAVLLVLFHDHLGKDLYTVIGGIPVGVLVALGIGELLAFSLFSAGLMLLKGSRRYPALAAILGAFLLFYAVNGFSSPALALLVPIIVLAIFAEIANRRNWSWGRVMMSAALVALVACVILSIYVAEGSEGQVLVISAISFQALIAMFGLFMAATDIAEVISVAAETTSSKVVGAFRSVLPTLFLTVLAVIANVYVALGQTDWATWSVSSRADFLGKSAGLVPWLALLYWPLLSLGKRLGAVSPEIGYRGLLLVVGLYFVAFQSGILLRVLSNPQSYDPKLIFGDPQVFTPPVLLFVCFLLLFFILGRRSPRIFVVLAYAICVGMLWFHIYSSHGELFETIQISIAIGSVIFLLVAALLQSGRRQFRALCIRIAELNLNFAAYSLILRIVIAPKGESLGFNISEALLLFAALAWDILSSGGSVTNKDTISFPRMSRVCIFLSYIVSVALLVVVSTGSHLINPRDFGAVKGVFESEPLVAVGFSLFGPAFFFLVFALQVREVRVKSVAGAPSRPQTPVAAANA